MNLQNLQPELLILIFCYLDSHFLITNVSMVCKRFNGLINDNYTWKSRFKLPFKSLYVYTNDETTDWKKVVYAFESERYRWKKKNLNKFKIRTDAVHNIHLINNGKFCVSDGFRGRQLKIWNLQELVEPRNVSAADVLVTKHENAHELPILSLTSFGLSLCSGGADSMIHVWQLENKKIQCIFSAKCKSYVFCLSMHESVVAAGTLRYVSIYDIRSNNNKALFELPVHREAVTDVYIDEDCLISSGTDSNVSFYDRRANKVLTKLRCPSFPRYINRLSFGYKFLVGGDSQGAIHLWDTSGRDFKFIQTIDTGHNQFITGLNHTMGCVISGCADGKLNVSSMTYPSVIWSSCLKRYVTDLHYHNKILVSAADSELITIWKPKAILVN